MLLAAEGRENLEIARRLDTPVQIVSKRRKRFFGERLAGLAERSRTGRQDRAWMRRHRAYPIAG